MPEIILQHVTKRFDKFVAVQDLDLQIQDRGFITLLGPSGCGKTTTLRMIAGLETPTSGRILIDGVPVFDSEKGINLPPNKRDIGFLFQNYALWPHMTVYENIAFGLEMLKWDKARIRKRVDELLALLKIEQFEKRYPAELSGGQQQRVAIARTLAPSPKVLFMDEPLSNLDAKLRQEMRTELKRLHSDTNSTFVYVTHDQLEAMTLSTKVCLMDTGVLQQYAPPLEIYGHPANLFVAGFIGSPQMNFFENCQLTKTADSYTLTVMGETVTLTAEQSAKLAAAGVESRSVTAGVRPVHIALGESGIPAEVDVSELMGSELHLHLAANGQDVVAVIPTANIDPMAYARHTAVKFGFDAKLVHLFDSDSEKNLI